MANKGSSRAHDKNIEQQLRRQDNAHSNILPDMQLHNA